MKNWSRITTIVIIIITAAGLIAYDIVKAADDSSRDTLSAVMLTWGFKCSFVPMFWGILCGHFFCPSGMKTETWKFITLAVTFVVLGTLGTIHNNILGVNWFTHPMVFVIVGILNGAFFWPQKKSGV